MAKKSLLDKALKSVKKTSKKVVKKLVKDKGANAPQSKKYSVGKDASRKAKPQGYRFTDAGARALGIRTTTKPTAAQIKQYKDKRTAKGHRYLYKEMRLDKSDESRSQKFAKGGHANDSSKKGYAITRDIYDPKYSIIELIGEHGAYSHIKSFTKKSDAKKYAEEQGWKIVNENYKMNYKKGGTTGEHLRSNEYLELEVLPNGNLKLTLTEEGKERVKEDNINENSFSDLFETIQGNSDLMYFNDLGEAELGMTSAPGITDGYYYDDNGDLEWHKDARLWYYNHYALHSFVEKLVEEGSVVFDKADEYKKGGTVDKSRVSNALHAYKTAAIWSSNNPDTDEPLDSNYTIHDFDKETDERMKKDVYRFYEENMEAINASGLDDEQIGHDFWLTRNHHGAGFFDRGLDDEVEEKLMKAALEFGECDLFVVDGKIVQVGGKYTHFKKGGHLGFDKLAKKVAKNYKGKKVPAKYRKLYGKDYDAREATEVGRKVAGKIANEKRRKFSEGGDVAGYRFGTKTGTYDAGEYEINIHGMKPEDYVIIGKKTTIDGKKVLVTFHMRRDGTKPGVEVYGGENYIVGSKERSYSRLYEYGKQPKKYNAIVQELKDVFDELWGYREGFKKGGKLNKSDAIKEAEAMGVDFDKDFHEQSKGNELAELAKKYGYKKPVSASGSTGRYFFYHLQKIKTKKFAAGGLTGGDDPKIYVADLAAYNAGELKGEWINLNDYSDADELMEAIDELGYEEWSIHDTENIPRSLITEGSGKQDFEKFYAIKAKAEEMSVPVEVLLKWKSDTGGDIDNAGDAYQGEYDDKEDYAYRMVEDGAYTPSSDDVYVSDTDKRIIAGEQEDFAIDGRDDDELIGMADMEDELKELQDKQDEIESLESEIEDLESELNDLEEGSEEYEEVEGKLQEKKSELEGYGSFDFDDAKDELVERAKDKVKEEEYDKWYQGLDSDPIYFLVKEEGIYSEEDALKLPWIQVDYEAVARELGYDVNFVEHDGKVYAFSSNYRKGGELKGDADVKVYTPDMFAAGGTTSEKYDDELQAEDVELFAENNSQLYNSRYLPILKNLKKKLDKGTFDLEKSAILWKYYWEDADKRYQKEVLHRNPNGFVLSVNDRKLLSMKKAKEIKEEYDDSKLEGYFKAGGNVNAGMINDITPGAYEFRTGGLTAPARINNAEAKEYTENHFPFRGNNIEGKVLDNGDYVVLGYGYYPIWYWCSKENKWYGTTDKYSNTTARQISQSRPTHDATMLSHNELLEKMRSEEARFDLGGIMTQDLIRPINNTDAAHN